MFFLSRNTLDFICPYCKYFDQNVNHSLQCRYQTLRNRFKIVLETRYLGVLPYGKFRKLKHSIQPELVSEGPDLLSFPIVISSSCNYVPQKSRFRIHSNSFSTASTCLSTGSNSVCTRYHPSGIVHSLSSAKLKCSIVPRAMLSRLT